MSTEDLLRGTLDDRAGLAQDTLTLEDVRRDAAVARRRSTWRTTGLAAAAILVVVGAPTAFLLRPHDSAPGPAPAPTPTVTAPSPTAPQTSDASTPVDHPLEQIPQGLEPGIDYLQDGVVHLAQGGTLPFPVGKAPVAAFAGYHGGWLVANAGGGPERVSWYDGSGTRQSDGPGSPMLAVSEDGTRTAYPQSGAIHIGITSGMGEGEQTVPISGDRSWPIGFLRGDALVYQDGAGKVAVQGGAVLSGMSTGRAVSAEADLVAGSDSSGNTVVMSGNGTTTWTSTEWTVWAFSQDGRYAAATNGPDGSAITTVAILDARTGDVVAQHAAPGNGISVDMHPVMDVDGSLLVPATDGNTLEETVLRLDQDGTLTRATRVYPLDGSNDMAYVLFATRP